MEPAERAAPERAPRLTREQRREAQLHAGLDKLIPYWREHGDITACGRTAGTLMMTTVQADFDQEPSRSMTGLDPRIDTAENYRRFARWEAAGRSPLYATLADAVADDEVVLTFLGRLAVDKRQPNLLFAAARYLLGSPPDADRLHTLVAERPDNLAQVMNTRRTQTNEAARCAVMLPALAALPQPLALIEVGASAGLTLLPDRYSYDYNGYQITGLDPQAPTLACRPSGPVPLPTTVPTVAWRAGIDLNPLDINDNSDLDWLSCLIWPGEKGRIERLRAAAGTARRQPPTMYRGDLLEDLPAVAAKAPSDATLVVYHTAVLAYVGEDKRRAFAAAVKDLGAAWLSNEGENVLPNVSHDHQVQGNFLLVRNGSEVLARTDPHGSWVEWT